MAVPSVLEGEIQGKQPDRIQVWMEVQCFGVLDCRSSDTAAQTMVIVLYSWIRHCLFLTKIKYK